MRRMTNQKKMMHGEIKKFSMFFDAYGLHERVSKKNSKLGLATIYRFLNSMESTGEIHSFVCGKTKIYSNSETSHAHFKCESCGKVRHLKIKNVDFLKEFLEDEVCHFQIELAGVCAKCRKKSL